MSTIWAIDHIESKHSLSREVCMKKFCRVDTIFMNSENNKTPEPCRLLLSLSDEMEVRRSDQYVFLSNLNISYTWKNIKTSYDNNNFKISAPPWNENFELPDGSYSIADIQEIIKYIIKKYETVTDNPAIRINVNKIEQRVIFKIKTDYYLEFLPLETMKLLRSSKSKITKNKNGENVPCLEITDVVLVLL